MYKVQVGSQGRGGTPHSQSSFSLLRVDGLAKFEFKPQISAKPVTSGQTALVYECLCK